MIWRYVYLHLPTGSMHESTTERMSRKQFLEMLNKWNAAGKDWKYWEP